MPYPILTTNPSLTLPREVEQNVLDSGQGNGRSLRRVVDPRSILGFRVVFREVNCGARDELLSLFESPFQLNTPDDGVVNVVALEDSLVIVQTSPTLFTISINVEEVLFTN